MTRRSSSRKSKADRAEKLDDCISSDVNHCEDSSIGNDNSDSNIHNLKSTDADGETKETIDQDSTDIAPTSKVSTTTSISTPDSLWTDNTPMSKSDTLQGDEEQEEQEEQEEREEQEEQGEQEEQEEQEEQWDLCHIFTPEQLNLSEPQQCCAKGCPLIACATYASSLDENYLWHTCIDCQENDYGGWPEEERDFPVKFLTMEHRALIVEKCTAQYSPAMPKIAINEKGDKMEAVSEEDGTRVNANTNEKKASPTSDCDGGKESSNCRCDSVGSNSKENTDANEKTKEASDENDINCPRSTKNSTSMLTLIPDSLQTSDTACNEEKTGSAEGGICNEEEQVDEEEQEEQEEQGEQGEQGEQEEQWELCHIFTPEQLNLSEPQQCCAKGCPLIACATYVSSLDENYLWHTCIDCQDNDYGGWPEEERDFPVKFLTMEHRALIVEKCTAQYSPAMPKIAINEKGDKMEAVSEEDGTHVNANAQAMETGSLVSPKPKHLSTSNLTPPPGQQRATTATAKTKKSLVTPSPVPPTGASKIKPSKATSKAYAKWQEQSRKLGGGGKLFVKKDEIKEMVFETMKDSFEPMNITDIYKRLKGTVPSVMLSTCLKDMALDHFNPKDQFADSDDEEGDKKGSSSKAAIVAHSSDSSLDGSIRLKPGRNANTSLYFVDYNRVFNGNGLPPEDKNELLCAHEQATAEMQTLQSSIRDTNTETSTLISEPLNSEAVDLLEKEEAEVAALKEEVEALQGLKHNEKKRKKWNRKIEVMAAQWRKRKRLCHEFFNIMEEATDGTISLKKCSAGDGQMDIDSDEAVMKGQKAYIMQKRNRSSLLGGRSRGATSSSKRQKTEGPIANELFYAVELESSGIKRVFMDDE